ncbi:hypothetical protein EV671_106217, partial [Roseateles saccharophilus]
MLFDALLADTLLEDIAGQRARRGVPPTPPA